MTWFSLISSSAASSFTTISLTFLGLFIKVAKHLSLPFKAVYYYLQPYIKVNCFKANLFSMYCYLLFIKKYPKIINCI